jgi:hypothetical protein
MAFVILPGRVNVNRDRLSDAHIPQLSFLKIGCDPDIVEIDDAHQFLPGLHVLSHLDGAVGDHAINRAMMVVYCRFSCAWSRPPFCLDRSFGGLRARRIAATCWGQYAQTLRWPRPAQPGPAEL